MCFDVTQIREATLLCGSSKTTGSRYLSLVLRCLFFLKRNMRCPCLTSSPPFALVPTSVRPPPFQARLVGASVAGPGSAAATSQQVAWRKVLTSLQNYQCKDKSFRGTQMDLAASTHTRV